MRHIQPRARAYASRISYRPGAHSVPHNFWRLYNYKLRDTAVAAVTPDKRKKLEQTKNGTDNTLSRRTPARTIYNVRSNAEGMHGEGEQQRRGRTKTTQTKEGA